MSGKLKDENCPVCGAWVITGPCDSTACTMISDLQQRLDATATKLVHAINRANAAETQLANALQSPPAEKVCVWRPIPGEAVVWVPKMQTDCGHALYPEFDHLSGGPPCPHCGGRIKVEDSCPA